jgi:type IV pilus assembly protein PilA
MRHFAITLAAAVLGMLIALLLYDRLVVQPRDAARADAIAKATEINLAKAHSEADTIAANLDAQVQRSVSSAREAMDAQAGDEDKRRLARAALDRAAMFKVALSEYYMSNGHWPASAQEAGLGAPGSFAGAAVARIDVGANGVVVVTLNDRLVRGATVRLTPEITSSGLVDWHCSVPGNDVLRRYLPACRG